MPRPRSTRPFASASPNRRLCYVAESERDTQALLRQLDQQAAIIQQTPQVPERLERLKHSDAWLQNL